MRELPRGWRAVAVREFVDSIQYGYTESSTSEPIGPRFLRITDIQENRVDWSLVPFCPMPEEDLARYQLQAGDLVFARTGATVGKSFLIKGEIPLAVFASYLIRLRFPKTVSNQFVAYFFQSPLYWQQIADKQVGTGQPNVNGTRLGQLEMVLPPLPEQARIVSKLDELFSDLDAGVASLTLARQQLKVYRQAVLKLAFEGRLVGAKKDEEGITAEDAEGAEGRRLPEGWRWEKLEDLCGFITKGTTPAKHDLIADQGEIPFVKVYNLTFDGRLDFSVAPTFVSRITHETGLARSKVVPGDVLMNIVGPPLGKVSVVPDTHPEWNINQAIARFRPKTGIGLANKYLANYLLANSTIEAYSKQSKATVGQINLTLEICRGIQIPLPPLPEQQAIVAEIERRFSVCDALEATIEKSLAQAESLRQSLLQKAFRGELVPQEAEDA